MSIWTPSGEHEVSKEETPTEGSVPVKGEERQPSPEEQEAMTRGFEETKQRIIEAPPEQIIATHIIGLYELAVIHLRQEYPNLEAAKLSIDALAAIVSAVGTQLGEYEQAMRNALSEIQMAYVKVNKEDGDGLSEELGDAEN